MLICSCSHDQIGNPMLDHEFYNSFLYIIPFNDKFLGLHLYENKKNISDRISLEKN